MSYLVLNYKRLLEETSHLCCQLHGYGIKNHVYRLSLLQCCMSHFALIRTKTKNLLIRDNHSGTYSVAFPNHVITGETVGRLDWKIFLPFHERQMQMGLIFWWWWFFVCLVLVLFS